MKKNCKLKALILLLACSGIYLNTGSAAAAQTSSRKNTRIIAAAPLPKPQMPARPSIRPTAAQESSSSSTIKVEDLFPSRSGGTVGDEAAEPPPTPLNTGNIEYSESLAAASTMPGLSIKKAMNEALVKGPRAAAVRSQLAIAMANYPQASQMPNPVFFFDRGLVAEQVNRIGPFLTYEEPWKLVFRMLIAKRLVAQTKIDLLTQIWSLRADLRRSYIELVVAQETQKTLKQLFELSSALLSSSEKHYQAGDVPELDVFKARLAASQAAIDLSVGKRRVLRAKQQLNILMGRDADAPLNVAALPDYRFEHLVESASQKSDILPDFDREVPKLNVFLEKALSNRLELRSLSLQAKVNKANLLNAYAEVLPDTGFGFGKSTAGNPAGGPKLNAVYMTLVQEIPFSDINQGPIWKYKATGRQLNYELAGRENEVTADVINAYNNLLAARKKLRVYQEKLLADSNKVARLARRSYEVGQSDITAALAAQQANVLIQNAYLDAVFSYGSAFTDLEFAIGKPLQ
ncbi:MAG: TolC family protein [Candidatus Obscuribacterales bacterium]|nr:TolC family protein [Candidatus Obscuribacterales bacterium]